MLDIFSCRSRLFVFFLFTDPAPTEIYTLSLHDALPISSTSSATAPGGATRSTPRWSRSPGTIPGWRRSTRSCRPRSEEHTSELQSRFDLVCRLLLEKKKEKKINNTIESKTTKRLQNPVR